MTIPIVKKYISIRHYIIRYFTENVVLYSIFRSLVIIEHILDDRVIRLMCLLKIQ